MGGGLYNQFILQMGGGLYNQCILQTGGGLFNQCILQTGGGLVRTSRDSKATSLLTMSALPHPTLLY